MVCELGNTSHCPHRPYISSHGAWNGTETVQWTSHPMEKSCLFVCLSIIVCLFACNGLFYYSTLICYGITELLRKLCTLDESANSSQNRTHLRSGLPRGEEEAWHPLYGFKRDVIRLLGNLLYRCGRVQDKVRERGGVSLILNQCGIDHRNPCIH